MTISGQSVSLDEQNPWPGLATYDEASRDFFFGREEEAEELLRLIRLSPLTVLYGKSGLGKSSLLQAGLFPKLRRAYFLPVYIRLDTANVAAVSYLEQSAQWFQEALKDSLADYPAFETGENLWRYLHRRGLEIWSQDNHLITPVFVFDQFEEVFAGANPELPQAQILCHDLADLVENKIPASVMSGHYDNTLDLLSQPYRVVLSFREDFLPVLKNWERDVPSLLKNWCQLQPMSRDHAIQAVTQSGAAIVAPGVAEQIVDFVGNLDKNRSEGDTAIEPVLLSLCCYQLNLRRQLSKAPRIDAELLRKAGQEILEGYYANALAKMPVSVAKFIETQLIQGDRYRTSYPEKLALEEGLITQKQLAGLTNFHRLLRVEQHLGAPRIELIHDRLVSVVRKARDLRRVKTEIKRAWLVALAVFLVAASFSVWQAWQESIKTEQLLQTNEQLRQTAEASLSRSFDYSLVVGGLAGWGITGERMKASKEQPKPKPVPQETPAAVPYKAPAQVSQEQPEQAHQELEQSKLIYLQIRIDKQRAAAMKIQELLRSNHFIVPGIETLTIGPAATEVRYFRENEAAQAQKIADLLRQQKIPGVTVKYIAGFENSKALPKGQFEIWFAPDAMQ